MIAAAIDAHRPVWWPGNTGLPGFGFARGDRINAVGNADSFKSQANARSFPCVNLIYPRLPPAQAGCNIRWWHELRGQAAQPRLSGRDTRRRAPRQAG
jgi:hypothetical protein